MKTAGRVQWDMGRRKAWGCGKGAQPEKQVRRSFAGVAAGTGRGSGLWRTSTAVRGGQESHTAPATEGREHLPRGDLGCDGARTRG